MVMAARWEKDSGQLQKWDELPLDEAKKLAPQGKAAMEQLSAATKLKDCDLKVDLKAMGDVDASFLNGAKLLCQMACLHARLDLESGKTAEGLERFREVMLMGRRLREVPRGSTRAMGGWCELNGIEGIAIYVPTLHAPESRQVTQFMKTLPESPTREKVLEVEAPLTIGEKRNARNRFLEWFKAQDDGLDATRAMFAVALAERIEGEAALKGAEDPISQRPFDYRKWDGGYEITSQTFWPNSKNAKLTVGKEKGK
jgi:hypothetical protein